MSYGVTFNTSVCLRSTAGCSEKAQDKNKKDFEVAMSQLIAHPGARLALTRQGRFIVKLPRVSYFQGSALRLKASFSRDPEAAKNEYIEHKKKIQSANQRKLESRTPLKLNQSNRKECRKVNTAAANGFIEQMRGRLDVPPQFKALLLDRIMKGSSDRVPLVELPPKIFSNELAKIFAVATDPIKNRFHTNAINSMRENLRDAFGEKMMEYGLNAVRQSDKERLIERALKQWSTVLLSEEHERIAQEKIGKDIGSAPEISSDQVARKNFEIAKSFLGRGIAEFVRTNPHYQVAISIR